MSANATRGSFARFASKAAGSRTPTMSRVTDAKAGTAASQNTARKSPANHSIAAMASKGPRTAPTVSSAWRSPYAAPWEAGGVMSAISASRGAPRMPFPTRSINRAVTTQPNDVAKGNKGLLKAASPYPSAVKSFRRRK